jgi:hypothetical protein
MSVLWLAYGGSAESQQVAQADCLNCTVVSVVSCNRPLLSGQHACIRELRVHLTRQAGRQGTNPPPTCTPSCHWAAGRRGTGPCTPGTPPRAQTWSGRACKVQGHQQAGRIKAERYLCWTCNSSHETARIVAWKLGALSLAHCFMTSPMHTDY